jgi:hypothetical protein
MVLAPDAVLFSFPTLQGDPRFQLAWCGSFQGAWRRPRNSNKNSINLKRLISLFLMLFKNIRHIWQNMTTAPVIRKTHLRMPRRFMTSNSLFGQARNSAADTTGA